MTIISIESIRSHFALTAQKMGTTEFDAKVTESFNSSLSRHIKAKSHTHETRSIFKKEDKQRKKVEFLFFFFIFFSIFSSIIIEVFFFLNKFHFTTKL